MVLVVNRLIVRWKSSELVVHSVTAMFELLVVRVLSQNSGIEDLKKKFLGPSRATQLRTQLHYSIELRASNYNLLIPTCLDKQLRCL